MAGTLNDPPPMPIRVEIDPIPVGIRNPAIPCGTSLQIAFPCDDLIMLIATLNATTAKTAASTCPVTFAAITIPATAPMKINGDQ